MTKAWAGGLCKTGHYFSALDTDQEGVTHRGSDVRASILKELKIKMGFGGGGGKWKLEVGYPTPPTALPERDVWNSRQCTSPLTRGWLGGDVAMLPDSPPCLPAAITASRKQSEKAERSKVSSRNREGCYREMVVIRRLANSGPGIHVISH